MCVGVCVWCSALLLMCVRAGGERQKHDTMGEGREPAAAFGGPGQRRRLQPPALPVSAPPHPARWSHRSLGLARVVCLVWKIWRGRLGGGSGDHKRDLEGACFNKLTA